MTLLSERRRAHNFLPQTSRKELCKIVDTLMQTNGTSECILARGCGKQRFHAVMERVPRADVVTYECMHVGGQTIAKLALDPVVWVVRRGMVT